MTGNRPARIASVRAYGRCRPASGRWFYVIDLGCGERWLYDPFTTEAAARTWAQDNGYRLAPAQAVTLSPPVGVVSGRG